MLHYVGILLEKIKHNNLLDSLVQVGIRGDEIAVPTWSIKHG